MPNLKAHCYCFVEKETNRCFQVLETDDAAISYDNEELYSFEPTVYSTAYVGKYYVDGVWYERTYTYDDAGGVTGYTDTVWEDV